MKPIDAFDLPPEKQGDFDRARRLEWWTLAYVAGSMLVIGLTMGGSQAMRTSFFEDAISAVPALAFLICTRIARRRPNETFPYGYHGAVSIGYLVASVALLAMGAFLLIDAALKLWHVERTTIGGVTIAGQTIWSGWLMVAATIVTLVPGLVLGRLKMAMAPRIHDKILYADARMMQANWITAAATGVGVIGVGFGFWWIDPVAAALISVDILKDGIDNIGVAMGDLMERRPMRTDRSGPEPLVDELRACIERLDWVAEADVRLREVGHVFFGEVFVTPAGSPTQLPAKIAAAVDLAKSINWRLHDVTITVLN